MTEAEIREKIGDRRYKLEHSLQGSEQALGLVYEIAELESQLE